MAGDAAPGIKQEEQVLIGRKGLWLYTAIKMLYLQEAEISKEEYKIDYLGTETLKKLSAKELEGYINKSGLPLKRFFNTSGSSIARWS